MIRIVTIIQILKSSTTVDTLLQNTFIPIATMVLRRGPTQTRLVNNEIKNKG